MLFDDPECFVRNDMWWATAKGGDRSDGLSFGSRGNFLGHHAARFRFHPSAARRQPEHPKCNNVLRFDAHLKNLHAPREPRIEHFWVARQLDYSGLGLRWASTIVVHLFGHFPQSLYHDLERVVARVPYKAPLYKLIQYFARGHPLA